MPIIKASNSAPLLKDAIVLDLGDLARQGEQLKNAARAEAERILAEAKREAERTVKAAQGRGFDQGKAEGFQIGLEEGLKLGRQEAIDKAAVDMAALKDAWGGTMKRIEDMREQMEQEARRTVLQLALKLGEKVAHRIVEVDVQVAADALADALSHVLRPVDVAVHIHRDDRAAMEAALPGLMAEFTQCKHIRVIDDEKVSRGGCIVTYGQGKIDATIETKLRRIAELLLPGDPTNS